MSELRQVEGAAARALEIAALCASRRNEVLGAKWSEVDVRARTWEVPGERMKRGKPHKVPLSDSAIALLQGLPRRQDSEFIFTDPTGRPISGAAMLKTLQKLRAGATQHGLRSSFRDWCAERTAFPREVAEAALAHAIPNAVEASYLRGGFWKKRVRLMNKWARYCCSPSTEDNVVVPMARSGRGQQ